MALKFALAGDILEVTEEIHSFTSTRRSWWYYDVRLWLGSAHGKQHEAPTRVLDAGMIKWIKDYYLPKVQKETKQ